LVTRFSFVASLAYIARRICAKYWQNCSNWVKSIKLGRILAYTLVEIFRYGAIKNSAQEANGGHFPIWPPVKHLHREAKTCHPTFVYIFAKCWPILKIFSLARSVENLQYHGYQISHHTLTASLHYLVKYNFFKSL